MEIQPSDNQPIIPDEVSETKDATAALSDEIPDWLKEIAEEMPEAGSLVSTGEEPVVESTESTVPVLAPEKLMASEEEPAQLTDDLPIAEGAPISEEAPTTQLPEIEESLVEPEMTEVPSELSMAQAEPISEEEPVTELPVMEESLPEPEITAVPSELSMLESAVHL